MIIRFAAIIRIITISLGYYKRHGFTKLLSRIISESRNRYVSGASQSRSLPLYWMYSEGKPNFGDELNEWLFLKITGEAPSRAPRDARYEHVFAIGSILKHVNKRSIVWGSGGKAKTKPKEILATRGPLTKRCFEELKIYSPDIFGDPAILTPIFYTPTPKEKYNFILAPHITDYALVSGWYKEEGDIRVIDLKTRDFEGTIDCLVTGDLLICSSLHALIIGMVYGLPVVWAVFQSDLSTANPISTNKFIDFFQGVGFYGPYTPLFFGNRRLCLKSFDFNPYILKLDLDKLAGCQENLLRVCPFSRPMGASKFTRLKPNFPP
jgi:pyruvyltransferase